VLGHFTKEELAIYDEIMPNVAGAVELMVWDEINQAMNEYNKKAK
jgi:PTH1 family peptidyl-tRNA hydrolase